MPIEIRELVIKATIGEPKSEGASFSKAQTQEKEEIIAECVEQVMEILRNQLER
jgi:hypothetical protein